MNILVCEWGKQMYVYMYQLRFELAASNIKPQQWLKQKRSLFPFLVLSKAGSWQLPSVTASQSSELQQALSVVLLPILNIKLNLGCSLEGLQQGPRTECLLSKYRGLGPLLFPEQLSKVSGVHLEPQHR